MRQSSASEPQSKSAKPVTSHSGAALGRAWRRLPLKRPLTNTHTRAVMYNCKRCGWTGEVNGRPRCLPCCALATAAWRKANPEKKRDLSRRMEKKLRTERPEETAAKKRAKYRRNLPRYRARYAKRAEWLRVGNVTKEELVSLHESVSGKCFYCGVSVSGRFKPSDPRGFDHVIPRSKGGIHTIANLVVCCRSCNERRSDRN